MTKQKVILYILAGILTGTLVSGLFPLNLNVIFGEPTALSITVVLLNAALLISLTMFPVIKYYKNLEN